MRSVSEYGKITNEQLREELVLVMSALASEYDVLGAAMADHQQDYITTYVRSPGNSVAAKSREAQYNCMDQTRSIIESRAKINSLTLCRDLIVFLLLSEQPGHLPFPQLADFDETGMVTI
jgi:hypothetical protein